MKHVKVLESFINEADVSKIKIGSVKANFTIMTKTSDNGDLLVFIPKTSNDLDIVYDAYDDTDDVIPVIANHINSQFKDIEFVNVPGWPGAGHAFKVDLQKLVSKIK